MDDFSFFREDTDWLMQFVADAWHWDNHLEILSRLEAASEVLKVLPANTNFEASKSWKAHGEPAAGALSLCELTFNLSKYVICGPMPFENVKSTHN